jgi:hypothetical protein
MLSNDLCVISKNDHLAPSLDNIYRGKYTIGRFHLTDAFIIEYMKIIHNIEIPDSWVNSGFPSILDIDNRKVIYMQCCDILSNSTMNEIRNAVKCPPDNITIYRKGENITKIDITKK